MDEKNEVAYNPFPLELLKRFSDVCKEMQQRLQNEENELERQTPASLKMPKCKPDTKVGKLIATLSEKTKPDDVTSLGQLSDEEQKRYETLKVDLASDPAATARKLNAHNTQLGRCKTQVDAIWNAASDQALLDVQGKYNDYLAKKEAAKVAADTLFKGESLPNIGADTWRTLWDAARRYSEAEAYPECTFPHTEADARCVFCHQTLSPEATKRLQSFETFVKAEAKKAEEAVQLQYQRALATIKQPSVSMTVLTEMFRFLKDEIGNEDLAESLKKCVVAQNGGYAVSAPEAQIQTASKSLIERATVS